MTPNNRLNFTAIKLSNDISKLVSMSPKMRQNLGKLIIVVVQSSGHDSASQRWPKCWAELDGTNRYQSQCRYYLFIYIHACLILSLESSNIRKKKKSHVRYLTMLLNIARIAQSKD